MSFEKINNLTKDVVHPRECVIFYNFTQKELSLLKNVGNLTGIRDQIILTPNHSNTLVKDVLDNNLTVNEITNSHPKAIIFNVSNPARMNAFIEGSKKCRMSRPLTAMVTNISLDWDIDTLISNLLEERSSLNSGNPLTH